MQASPGPARHEERPVVFLHRPSLESLEVKAPQIKGCHGQITI